MTRKKLCYYNRANSHLFVNGIGIIKFKAKDSELNATPLCLGNISKDFSIDNIKRLDFMNKFMNSVLTMMLLQLMIY